MPIEVVVLTLRRHHRNNKRREWWNRTYKEGAGDRKGIAAKKWFEQNDKELQKIFSTSKNWQAQKNSSVQLPQYHLKDWLIIQNPNGPNSEVHFVSGKMLGNTGSLYQHNGKRWEHLITRYTVSKSIRKDEDVSERYVNLGWVEGEKGALLLTSATSTNAVETQAMLRGDMPVAYKYVSGMEASDAVAINDLWQVHGQDQDIVVNITAEQAARAELEDKIQETLKIISSDVKKGKKKYDTKNKLINDGLKLLFEGATPGIEAGTATPIAATNMIAGWAGSKDLAGPILQGGHEAAGIGVKLVLDLYRLYKHNKDKEEDHRGRKSIYHDIVSSVAKGPPAVTAVVDTIGKIANAGKQMAGIATTANSVMPLVGAVIAFEESGRNFRKSDKAFKRLIKLKTAAGWWLDDGEAGEINPKSELGLLTQYAIRKLSRRGNRTGVTGIAGVFGGVGGTVIGVAAATGAANAWNPIGWTLMSVALVGGVGVTGYVIYRKATKKERHKKREEKGRPATSQDYAKRLLEVYRKGYQGEENHFKVAEQMLAAFGVPVKDGILEGIDEAKAINRIDRHLTR